MLDLTRCREVVRREIAADLARLERIPQGDWESPTRLPLGRCGIWPATSRTASDWRQRRCAGPGRDPRSGRCPDPGPDRGSILAAIRRNHEQLLAEMDWHTPESLGSVICPMYYGPVPGPLAVNGPSRPGSTPTTWPPPSERISAGPGRGPGYGTVLGASLPLLAMAAAERPASSVAFVLAGDTVRLDLRYDGASWQPGPPARRPSGSPATTCGAAVRAGKDRPRSPGPRRLRWPGGCPGSRTTPGP